jgi:hypothetical protein
MRFSEEFRVQSSESKLELAPRFLSYNGNLNV